MSVCANIAGDSSAYLFFLRVRAIYLRSSFITLGFGALWLCLVAMHIVPAVTAHPSQSVSILATFENLIDIHLAQLSEYNYCKLGHAQLPIVSIFVYDTLVWLAITHRLAADSWTGSSWRSRFLSIIHGEGLHSLSRALMRSGQFYYLCASIARAFRT